MATKETPTAAVKRLHGSKDKLVASLVGPLSDGVTEADEDSLKARLATVSNQKLIHLAAVVAEVKKAYGSRAKLVAQLAKSQSKDKDYLAKLATVSLPRLLDLARSGERRAKRGTVVRRARNA